MPGAFIRRVLFLSLSLILGGCIFLPGGKRISRLEGYFANRTLIEEYIKQQDALYSKLRKDIDSGALRPGISKQMILSEYSDPILCKESSKEQDPEVSETCLFRHPTRYFSANKIYLHFDENHELYSWRIGQES